MCVIYDMIGSLFNRKVDVFVRRVFTGESGKCWR